MKNKNILYVAYATDIDALNVASSLTLQSLQSLGFRVHIVYVSGNVLRFASEFLTMLHYVHTVQYLYITIDGRGALDKFSLLKLFKPSLLLIWEIHGHPKEPLWQSNELKIRLISTYRSIQRRVLAKLVNASVSTTNILAHYAHGELTISHSIVLPSYVSLARIQKSKYTSSFSKKLYFSRNFDKKLFIVFWGGGSSLRWQALDTLERVAQYTYERDKHILFVVSGLNTWHKFSFQKNIVFYPSVPYEEYFHFIEQADVCLALYHDRSKKITGLSFYYSPRKIIEYMSCHKVVIASKIRGLKQIIRHGINGYLYPNTSKEIYAGIQYVKRHPKAAKTIQEEAYRTVRDTYTTTQAKRILRSMFTRL